MKLQSMEWYILFKPNGESQTSGTVQVIKHDTVINNALHNCILITLWLKFYCFLTVSDVDAIWKPTEKNTKDFSELIHTLHGRE